MYHETIIELDCTSAEFFTCVTLDCSLESWHMTLILWEFILQPFFFFFFGFSHELNVLCCRLLSCEYVFQLITTSRSERDRWFNLISFKLKVYLKKNCSVTGAPLRSKVPSAALFMKNRARLLRTSGAILGGNNAESLTQCVLMEDT